MESTGRAFHCPPESRPRQHSLVLRRNSCVAVGGTVVENHVQSSSLPKGATPNPLGLGKAVRTTDGGETWARSVIPPGVGTLRGVSCPTKTFCMAVGETPDGNRGVALVTTNSGRVWTHLSSPRGEERLSLVSCRTMNDCVVVVDNLRATIITTTNAGKSWAESSLPQPPTGPIGTDISEGISCPSSTHCFIVGGSTLGDGTRPRWSLRARTAGTCGHPSLLPLARTGYSVSRVPPQRPVWWWAEATGASVASFSPRRMLDRPGRRGLSQRP